MVTTSWLLQSLKKTMKFFELTFTAVDRVRAAATSFGSSGAAGWKGEQLFYLLFTRW
jgi:hypothetical protein